MYSSDNLLSLHKRSKPCLLFSLPVPIICHYLWRIHDVRLRLPRVMRRRFPFRETMYRIAPASPRVPGKHGFSTRPTWSGFGRNSVVPRTCTKFKFRNPESNRIRVAIGNSVGSEIMSVTECPDWLR
jgi:hypothetical protein